MKTTSSSASSCISGLFLDFLGILSFLIIINIRRFTRLVAANFKKIWLAVFLLSTL